MPFDGGTESYVRSVELELLDRTMELLHNPDRWCKGDIRDIHGRHCIIGALSAARVDRGETRTQVCRAIEQAIRARFSEPARTIDVVSFNDHRLTTHRDVLAVLRDAREIVAAKGV